VVFAGFVQARDMPAYYALGDVLVFPTLGDPYGHVVGEAMAAGLPVISTESAGEIRERISDGQTGFIVPAASVDVLADRMLQLAGDPALRGQFASRASTRVKAITHEDYARDVEALVDRTLSMPPRRTPISILVRGMGWCLVMMGGGWNRSPAPYVSEVP
jgi:glycosyltransferase involved in cell wall biosynthesis